MRLFKQSLPTQTTYYIQATAATSTDRPLVLKQGDTFGVFDHFGDIDAAARAEEGIYHHGTRFLSCLMLKLLEHRALLLSSTVRRDNVLLAVDLTNPDIYGDGSLMLARGTLHIYRSQFLYQNAFYSSIRIRNFALAPVEIGFTLEFGADFVDIFEVRGQKRDRRGTLREPRVKNRSHDVVLEYEGLDSKVRRTIIRSKPTAEVALPSRLHFAVQLPPQEEQALEFTFEFEIDKQVVHSRDFRYSLAAASEADHTGGVRSLISTSNEQFDTWLERSRADLNMLLTRSSSGIYPYAGVPWFSTPFGRDGITTALECLWVEPTMARGVLSYLAATQARDLSPERDAQPGKILHEAREGEMAATGEIPFGKYYGSVDSTPLFLILAGEYYRRTADLTFIRGIWRNIELASQWMDEYGDADRDGFVEYYSVNPEGLANQGWKDSHDSIFHSDGRLAVGPIALCEVQGYVYEAKLSLAELAAALGRQEVAETKRAESQRLREAFEKAFWCEGIGNYAIALDGQKQRCQVRASNAGHCLFNGIAEQSHVPGLAQQFTSEDFYTGWGIRTLSSREIRYNPMSYHNGSIWPHDNAIIAAGFSRYRLTHVAAKIMSGFFEASALLHLNRLPELLCGFPRRPGKGPTLYPVACSPQAWSAGAVFLMLQSCLGIRIDAIQNRIVLTNPVLPGFLEFIRIRNLEVGSAFVDLMVFRSGDSVAVTVERRIGTAEVLVVN